MDFKYLLIKAWCRLTRKNDEDTCERINQYFRNKGMRIGNCCKIYSDILTSEPYLVEVGEDVTISFDVQFLTHDNSICKINSEFTDLFGKIKVGNHCFIGARTLILGGVNIGDNVIIGAGSVVTKSIPANSIAVGNPIRIVSTLDLFKEKYISKGFNIDGLNFDEKKELLMSNQDKFLCK